MKTDFENLVSTIDNRYDTTFEQKVLHELMCCLGIANVFIIPNTTSKYDWDGCIVMINTQTRRGELLGFVEVEQKISNAEWKSASHPRRKTDGKSIEELEDVFYVKVKDGPLKYDQSYGYSLADGKRAEKNGYLHADKNPRNSCYRIPWDSDGVYQGYGEMIHGLEQFINNRILPYT